VWVFVQPDGPGLGRIAALVDSGRLRVEVAEVLELADAAKAHELLATGRTRGKIVLTA
jgi:NADPH:quinone reductase-like Zn-dependent oxidoreductase